MAKKKYALNSEMQDKFKPVAKKKPLPKLPKKATDKKSAQLLIKAKKPVTPPDTKPNLEYKKPGKPEPKILKGVMTERKLKTISDKNGFISFLLVYPLTDLLEIREPDVKLRRDCEAVACPSDQWQFEEATYTAYACNPKKNTVTILAKGRVFKTEAEVVEDDRQPDCVVTPQDDVTDNVPHGSGYGGVPTGQEARDAEDTKPFDGRLGRAATEDKPAVIPSDEPVKAKAWEDKLGVNAAVKFDASTWFDQASDADIVALADDEWAMSDLADSVALFCADGDPKLKEMLADLPKDGSFSCEVDREQAMAWVQKFRPELHPELVAAAEENNEYKHDKSGIVPG